MRCVAVLLFLGTALGCTGVIGDADDPVALEPGREGAPVLCEGERPVGIRMLRRLTVPELQTTLRTIFSMPDLALDLPLDPVNEAGLHTDEALLVVRPRFAAGVHAAALEIGASVASRRDEFSSCAEGESCAMRFVEEWGLRLYRRPLTRAERERYADLYAAMNDAGEPFETFVQWATVALVDSPHTLYRSELGEETRGRYALTDYELATSLAYSFTGGPPSDALLMDAARGRMSDPRAIAESLAWDESGAPTSAYRAVVHRFAEQWLRLPAIGSVGKDDPAFTAEVRAAMREETSRYLDAVLFEERGTFADLLLSRETFLNGTLARFYGFGDESATEFQRTVRPAGAGVGLLAQGSLLAVRATNAHSSPTRRGLLVRRDLLCQPVPPAPVGVDVFPETDAETTRERHQVLVDEDFCAGCHRLMEPIGFAFEGFDATGRQRIDDNGHPIDASGVIHLARSEIAFDGPEALASTVAELDRAQECMTSLLGAYAVGLDPERAACLFETHAELPVAERLVEVAGSAHFRERVLE
ncbi:MAG: DUF1592 domain-containing protein [Myxococcota bacterium]